MAAYLHWIDGMSGMQAADKAIGPAINLKVNPGDTVGLSVWAKYENKLSYGRGAPQSVLATALGSTFALTAGLESLPEAIQTFTDGLPLLFGATASDPDTRPYAYLNYLIFDEQFNSIDAGAMRVPQTAGFDPGFELLPHQEVKFQPVAINTTGYMYVWVSNESEATKVWFDDLSIVHHQSMVTQATDYGVWGEVLREQKTNVLDLYRYGYQGQFAEKDEETGWSSFELRMYDPVIGRWTSVDPKKQYYSPYLSMGNNPIYRIDSDGGFDDPVYSSSGLYRGNTVEGFTGAPIIYDGDAWFTMMTANELVDAGGKIIDQNAPILSNEAYANIFNDIISRLPELGDMGLLLRSSVSIYQRLGATSFNQGVLSTGPFNTTYPEGNGHFPVKVSIALSGNRLSGGAEITVENIQNGVGIHEFLGHGFLGYQGDKVHHKAYELQFKHPTWHMTTPAFQKDMKANYADYPK